jgi:hypothetical protein
VVVEDRPRLANPVSDQANGGTAWRLRELERRVSLLEAQQLHAEVKVLNTKADDTHKAISRLNVQIEKGLREVRTEQKELHEELEDKVTNLTRLAAGAAATLIVSALLLLATNPPV